MFWKWIHTKDRQHYYYPGVSSLYHCWMFVCISDGLVLCFSSKEKPFILSQILKPLNWHPSIKVLLEHITIERIQIVFKMVPIIYLCQGCLLIWFSSNQFASFKKNILCHIIGTLLNWNYLQTLSIILLKGCARDFSLL